MSLIAFPDLFPAVAEKESKIFSIANHETIPTGTYTLLELYCPYFACECAKADIFIIDSKGDECGRYCLGWNKKAFYDEYYKGGLPGVCYAPLAKQGEHAEAFLELLQRSMGY